MTIEAFVLNLPLPKPLRLAGSAVFLDLDGTLAPIATRPQDVGRDPDRTRRLKRLSAGLDGRLAVISGRTLADVDRILDNSVAAVAAVHGLVFRESWTKVYETAPHPALRFAVDRLQTWAASDPRLLLEDKGSSVALHFRMAPGYAAAARILVQRLADETGLFRQSGDMVEELRTPGADKGDAIRRFMQQDTFAGTTPIFVGDDATDEHGFAEVTRLGGFGVLVGRPRRTHARFGLRNVGDVAAWLEAASLARSDGR